MVLVWCLLGIVVFLEEKEKARLREQLWDSVLMSLPLPPPEKREERGGEVGGGGVANWCCLAQSMLMTWEKKFIFILGKVPARAWDLLGTDPKSISLPSRREARQSEASIVTVFSRKWKRVWVRGGDHGVAFLRAPTSKGWSWFYGKSVDVGEKVVICMCSQLQPQGPCTSLTDRASQVKSELQNWAQPHSQGTSCTLVLCAREY